VQSAVPEPQRQLSKRFGLVEIEDAAARLDTQNEAVAGLHGTKCARAPAHPKRDRGAHEATPCNSARSARVELRRQVQSPRVIAASNVRAISCAAARFSR